MNIVDVRTGLRRLSVPRRSADRGSDDRRQCERRKQDLFENDTQTNDEAAAPKKFVRVSLTPGERTLLQDMYLIEDE